MIVPFTLRDYETVCRAIVANRVQALPVVDALRQPPEAGFVILRFDVDERPRQALLLAQLLARCGLRGTFYWHAPPSPLFAPPLMAEVAALGHEIGYHYAVISRSGGDIDAAVDLFRAEVGLFRQAGFDVQTAAAHGSRDFPNQPLMAARPDLLDGCDLVGEAYHSVDFSRVLYISDARWTWRRFPLRADAQAVRARVGAVGLPALTTGAICDLLAGEAPRLYLNTHPGQWFRSPLAALYFRGRRRVGEQLRR